MKTRIVLALAALIWLSLVAVSWAEPYCCDCDNAPYEPYLLECRLSWDAGGHSHGCGGHASLESCEAAGRAGVASGEFKSYSCELTEEIPEHN